MNFSDFKRKFYYFVGKNNKSLHAIYDALYISGLRRYPRAPQLGSWYWSNLGDLRYRTFL